MIKHNIRPLWLFNDGYIIFETFNCFLIEIEDFLVSISEPVVRTKLIHEYVLTPYSLYAAVTSGIKSDDIIYSLKKLVKNKISKVVKNMIYYCTKLYGKIQIILHLNDYYIYLQSFKILKIFLNDKILGRNQYLIFLNNPNKISNTKFKNLNRLNYKEKSDNINCCFSFLGDTYEIESLKRRCIELDFPLLEEYDFSNDSFVPNIKIELKSNVIVRKYQEKALSKMFNKGRARSGVIVLPCGSGKTIVGISATSIIKKTTLVVCNSSVSVDQWRRQYIKWTSISSTRIKNFVSGEFAFLDSIVAEIVVTTYSMISFGGQRAKLSASLLREIKEREWGMVILDEVHVVPANIFRKVLGLLKTNCKLGLTATLLREDRKVGDIGFLIGPKLFEANWLDLEKSGFLAYAKCAEIYCKMPSEFYLNYLIQNNSTRQLLCALNPNKAKICDLLIKYHENRGDRILVFSDNVFALRSYATKIRRAFIYGATGSYERMKILKNFQDHEGETLFISRIGDTSIDLPEANVILQISSHYGSRRQEAQRLGRILRPKTKSKNAFFYSLISSSTEEIYYSSKRQQFLISQGYDFKTITNFESFNISKKLNQYESLKKTEILSQILYNNK